MNRDIRIRTTFPHHHKTQKLIRRIGKDGVYSLICLWLYIGENHPKGDISDLSNEDIAIAADWDKNPEDLVSALIEVGFLDESINPGGGIVRRIHDWAEHNPYAFYAPERSETARQNVLKRWNKKKGLDKGKDTNGIPTVYDSCTPSPIPSPSPFPKEHICSNGAFEKFWAAYPKKKSKSDALRAFKKINPSEQLLEIMLYKIKQAMTSVDWKKDNGQYIPYPATWLNKRRWEDEDKPEKKGGKVEAGGKYTELNEKDYRAGIF